jgi:hypothetical protein
MLSKAFVDRNLNLVEKTVDKRQLVFGENINYEQGRVLTRLIECRGIEVFFIYLSGLMRGANIVLTGRGLMAELRIYKG